MEVFIGLLALLSVFSISNKEYFDTMNQQMKEGYRWEKIECRAPDESLPHLAMETPIGNKYVCNKLVK